MFPTPRRTSPREGCRRRTCRRCTPGRSRGPPTGHHQDARAAPIGAREHQHPQRPCGGPGARVPRRPLGGDFTGMARRSKRLRLGCVGLHGSQTPPWESQSPATSTSRADRSSVRGRGRYRRRFGRSVFFGCHLAPLCVVASPALAGFGPAPGAIIRGLGFQSEQAPKVGLDARKVFEDKPARLKHVVTAHGSGHHVAHLIAAASAP